MNTKKDSQFRFVGDKEASTYRWELYLSNNGYIFDGYSKNKGQDEKHDKQALFQDCIARLLNNGYLDKTYQMLFFKREFMHKSKDTLLLEMYPTHYRAHNELQLDLATLKFLERVYTARQTGQGLNYKELLPPRENKRDVEARDFLFSMNRFPSEKDLVNHCLELCKKYERKRVEAWWNKVKSAYASQPGIPSPQPIVGPPAVAPALVDPDNQQTAANALNAVNALVNKHKSNR